MTFNAEFIAIIQTLIAEQGKDAFVNPARCKAFLPDYTKNEYTKERRLLLKVVETGAAREIDAAANLDICKKQQIRHLKEDLFMAEDVAADVINLLAFVLRGDTGRTILEAPKPAPQKPEETLYTISLNFQQSGPFSLKQLENMISSRRVSNDYWIRPGNETDWMPITALPELKPFFENVPQPTPATVPMPAKNDPVKDAGTQTTTIGTQETTPGKSEYKYPLVARILLTLCGIGLGSRVIPTLFDLIDSDLLLILFGTIAMSLVGGLIGKVWEKTKK
jgi:hypothetical protein